MAYKYIAFYKPYNVLSQFTREAPGQECLADYLEIEEKDIYPIGRLDKDSEGLLLLTNDKKFHAKVASPSALKKKIYWVQVDGDIDPASVSRLANGIQIKLPNGELYRTKACTVRKIAEPSLPERNPPVRFRANIPTSWIEMHLTEGKNRQIRKMCATVGFPVLRLVRYAVQQINIKGLKPGKHLQLSKQAFEEQLFGA